MRHRNHRQSKLSFPLFDSEKLWTYKEELLLLQFIEQYGFGNWDEIAKHLPSRTAQECLQHYNSYYIYGNLGKCKHPLACEVCTGAWQGSLTGVFLLSLQTRSTPTRETSS